MSGAVALEAGVDMGLWGHGFARLEEAVERGLVSTARLEEAVLRILEMKFRRGLFEEPFVAETNCGRLYAGPVSPGPGAGPGEHGAAEK